MTTKQLKKLYIKYNDMLVRCLRNVKFSKEDAEDVAQNVWLKLLKKDICDINNMKAFLITIASRLGCDTRKQNKITIDTTKEVIDRITNSESMRKWQESEQSSDLTDQLFQLVCLAATHTTRFDTSILTIIEDRLNGLTLQDIALKYGTTRQTVSSELRVWYKRIREYRDSLE